MFRSLLPLLVFSLCISASFAQNTSYFQQEVNYKINVQLDDENHEIRGNIEIEYINNAPNVLNEIYMHLWPNAYKNAKTALAKQQLRLGNRFMFYALEKELGYIDELDFKVNDEKVEWAFDEEHIDIAKLNLQSPLASGESMIISTPFHVKIPSGKISRLGHIEQSYQMTQWYPKPAVYDNEGWHAMPYLNMGEFFSEYGSFDVSITLPKNYVVGATGDLQTETEMTFLNELAEKAGNQSDTYDNSFPASSKELKTIRFTQEKVHDFAWFADKRWMVRKGEIILPNSGRKVTSWAMFTPNSRTEWARAIEYINDGTYYYSLWNGDYPYNQVTAVDGTISAGGGMEYPNVTVIGSAGSDLGLETVIVHEVGHNWFYGILGSNERTNAWMDEGLNSFNETRYFRTKYQDSLGFLEGMLPSKIRKLIDANNYPYQTTDLYAYMISAKNTQDQPMQCHSNDFTNTSYGTIVYKKTAVAMNYLMNSLGEERFDKAMQDYYEAWKYKHPAPKDLKRSLEQSTGKDLSWFFEEVVPSTKKTDYKLANAYTKKGQTIAVVKNKGEVGAPFQVVAYKDSAVVLDQWFEGLPPGDRGKLELNLMSDRVEIDPNWESLDYKRNNNAYRTDDLAGGIEPLSVKFLSGLDDPEKTQLFWAPLLAYNAQDEFMFGVNIHNATIPFKNTEFSLSPLYSFETERLNGFGRISHYRGKSAFHLQTQAFSYINDAFNKANYLRTGLTFTQDFNKRVGSNLESKMSLEMAHIYRAGESMIADDIVREFDGHSAQIKAQYQVSKTGWVNHQVLGTWRTYSRDIENEPFDNLNHYLELTYWGKTPYMKGHNIYWRVFAGAVLDEFSAYSLSSLGWTGNTDFTYDQLYLSRFNTSEDFLSRQIRGDQGGLYTNFGSNNLLSSARVDIELPKVKFISLFAGVAVRRTFETPILPSDVVGITLYETTFDTEMDVAAGFTVNLVKEALAVHIPLVTKAILNENADIAQGITFTFNIDKFNPFFLARNNLK